MNFMYCLVLSHMKGKPGSLRIDHQRELGMSVDDDEGLVVELTTQSERRDTAWVPDSAAVMTFGTRVGYLLWEGFAQDLAAELEGKEQEFALIPYRVLCQLTWCI